jgi:hypothetical protein
VNALPVVLGVLLAVVLFVGLGFLLSRVVLANNAKRARAALPPAGPRDFEESAVGLTAPFKAYGLLRITPAELFFVNGSTRQMLQVQRHRIAACVASEDVPTGSGMQTLRRKALVLQLKDPSLPQGVAFMVSDPDAWVQRIRQG